MTHELRFTLPWLAPPPGDFSAVCRKLPSEPEVGRRARALATHALDENQLNRLATALHKARNAARDLAPLSPFKLGIIGNATTHFLPPVLEATALRHGFVLECVEADYGQVAQSALSPDSSVNRAGCDAVLLALDHRALGLTPTPGDDAAAATTVEAAIAQLATLRAGVAKNSGAACIVQSLPRPVDTLFGNLDAVLPGTERDLIARFNLRLGRCLHGGQDLLLDVANLAESVGLAAWHDPKLYNLAKLPFKSDFLPLYAEHVCRLLGALRGKSKKCLILDLDNTLWGGVIGDDGLDGIVLGQGDATGEAHLELQRCALELRGRGVLLAVSSKNTDEVAREPFAHHPEMVLREHHIAVFQANWEDKASNIVAIARELDLGLDSMVFVDDNPVERALVRRLLPEVAVPELPDDPALYARTLRSAGYFEAVAFSDEDRKRAELYQDNARRVALQKQAGDVEGYLQSLAMRLTVQPFDDTGRSRIAQLINKSNQFNLTTRRYTEAEVALAQRDPSLFTLQVRLADSFGDNGMISVLICRADGESWDVQTWLMSCRVLGRKVEHALLQELVAQAKERGARRLVGTYIPTEKNKLVEQHYERLGFSLLEGGADGSTRWQLELDGFAPTELPMTVERVGFAEARVA